MILTVISPDRLTQSMFFDYCKKVYPDTRVVAKDISCMYSADVQEAEFKDLAIEKSNLYLVKYLIKPVTKIDSLPACVMQISDYVVQFDLYSLHPEVLKSQEGGSRFMTDLIAGWQRDVEKPK